MANSSERKRCIDIDTEEIKRRFLSGEIRKFPTENKDEMCQTFDLDEIYIIMEAIESVIQEMEANGGHLPPMDSNTLNVYFY